MITEDYISFETSKLLSKNGFGFPDDCFTYYSLNGVVCEKGKSDEIGITPRPTLQMAMKWLREKHNLHIVVDWRYDTDPSETNDYSISYMYVISSWNSPKEHFEETSYKTCEQAREAAIKYCLENLI